MAFIYALGVLDIVCASILALSVLGYSVPQLQAPFAGALAFKGVMFSESFASRIDIICAIVMIALLWMPTSTIAALIATYLLIKGVASFV